MKASKSESQDNMNNFFKKSPNAFSRKFRLSGSVRRWDNEANFSLNTCHLIEGRWQIKDPALSCISINMKQNIRFVAAGSSE
jgi:hypothetical protein